MQNIPIASPDVGDHPFSVGFLALFPLLEFKDHGAVAKHGVPPSHHAVEPLGGHWQLVFHEYSVVTEIGPFEDHRYRPQRVPPRSDFAFARLCRKDAKNASLSLSVIRFMATSSMNSRLFPR